ncbi:ubiquitin-like modifier-activating enzyme ATG7 [Elysia marginata]|uniref:Ubiquitin-like modifier-activating enzyme ATG7 n=1 Tax=Elysia marginata TaxID=1093978 RepID=A0AAV4JKF2_9GAST|nr:ubiquitin-like modifier-activating enzyme ATG7 [Elysia marginata]
MAVVQYAPFASLVDPGFWHKLCEKKLDEYGLDDSARHINGFYTNGNAAGIAPFITVDHSAFASEWMPTRRSFAANGVLYITNTIDKFKEMDKKALLAAEGNKLWEDIKTGTVLQRPEKLCPFVLLTFADLKKYHFYYWFAFPALKFPDKPASFTETPIPLHQKLSGSELRCLLSAYDTFQEGQECFSGFFLVKQNGEGFILDSFANIDRVLQSSDKVMVGVCDPSSAAGYPGWPVRNLVSFLSYRYNSHLKSVTVLCIRDRTQDSVRDFGNSLVFSVELAHQEESALAGTPECVGWEKNERQKMGPRMVNLISSMDPTRLAESAVDLNLKLMRWRLLPDLQLEKIAATKCLVLGSGTLGCNVARLLMGWGMRHITMVDNSKVSYSNPVRQSLFTFEHCLDGGQPKAQAAASSLKTIFPGMNSSGISLSIPMPGHTITDSMLQQTKEDVKRLEDLIEAHDAVFLLMDTRESRWLPSLISASKKKIVINAALGFDTFLVLRHGIKTDQPPPDAAEQVKMSCIPGCQLGCYFCNDVVAPGNSTRDRTLDQQCTVTRPGLSMVASALAVELLVSILQHPLGAEAPADTSANDDHFVVDSECSLGVVPHQIRGFLSRFHQILPASQAFSMCTACCPLVLEKYRTENFDFLLKAFNEVGYLENITGLAAMQDATLDDEVWGLSDDDDLSSVDMETS